MTLVTTIAGMWLQGTIPGYGVEQMLVQMLVQNKMRDALTTLLAVSDRDCHCHRMATISIFHRHNEINASHL